MTTWKNYIEEFYKMDGKRQSQLWSELTLEEKRAFQVAYDGGEPSELCPELSKETPMSKIDLLIANGNELLAIGGDFQRLFRGSGKKAHQFTAWRLECIGFLRDLGPPAQHLLETVQSKKTEIFYEHSGHSIQQILGAIAAARAIENGGQPPALGRTEAPKDDKSVFVVHGHDHYALQRFREYVSSSWKTSVNSNERQVLEPRLPYRFANHP